MQVYQRGEAARGGGLVQNTRAFIQEDIDPAIPGEIPTTG
jgi:hypothetical protein